MPEINSGKESTETELPTSLNNIDAALSDYVRRAPNEDAKAYWPRIQSAMDDAWDEIQNDPKANEKLQRCIEEEAELNAKRLGKTLNQAEIYYTWHPRTNYQQLESAIDKVRIILPLMFEAVSE